MRYKKTYDALKKVYNVLKQFMLIETDQVHSY